MVAVVALVVERDGEDLLLLELLEHLLAAGAPEQLVAEPAREQGRAREVADEEVAKVGVELVRARSRRGTRATSFQRARSAASVRRRSLGGLSRVARWKSCSPAAQPSVRRASSGELLRRQRVAVELVEQALDLPGAEAQVVRVRARAASPRPAAGRG